MKKRMKSLIAVLAVCCAFGVSVACGGEEDVESGNAGVSASQPMDSDSKSSEETVEDKEIEGVTFTDREYTYDGQEKTLLVTGDLPDGVTASYQGNKGA